MGEKNENIINNISEHLIDQSTTTAPVPQIIEQHDRKKIDFIKASEPLLRQTIGRKRQEKQMTLFEEEISKNQELRENCLDSNITEIGMNLNVSERQALHTVQTLFTNKNYPEYITFTISEYLSLFGVKKYKTNRGYIEYSSAEREDALQALFALEKPILIYWRKKNNNVGKQEKYDLITYVEPIIKIKRKYHNITLDESNKITNGEKMISKIAALEITASKIFRYDSSVFMPEYIFKLIREKYKKPSTHFLNFITLLYLELKHKKTTVVRYEETLIDELHLGYLEKSRQKKRIAKYIEDDCQKSVEIGLVKSYRKEKNIKGEKIIIELNDDNYLVYKK